ncbi:MAG: calcium-translocating P-type ATPase, SERCA-type [Halothermotrichaceae bacterium]
MTEWYNKSINEVKDEYNTDLETGLSSAEAEKSLNKYGPNSLKKGKIRTPIQMFIEQFKDALVIILLLSAVVSALLGEVTDALVIAIILITNSSLGVFQEYKAEKSLAALKEMTAPEALVIRDGKKQQLEANKLVPGDVVTLETGDYVPADMRLFAVSDMKVEESALTGESVPVGKDSNINEKEKLSVGDQHNMAFMGTAVTYGRGKGIVTATGMDTQMGEIAGMLDENERETTPLQHRLDRMGKKLGIIVLIIVAFVVLVGLMRGIVFFDIFMTGISLAVAAVPEGLPAVVTIVLALGVQRMIKKHAIIRRLPAVETLGATTTICSDKTGTLTQNQMTITTMYMLDQVIEVTGEGYKPEGDFRVDNEKVNIQEKPGLELMLKAALLCNNAELTAGEEGEYKILGDPTEGSLVVAAAKAGYKKDEMESTYERIKELPFDSDRKRMSTINKTPEGDIAAFVKGAPDEMIEVCSHYYSNGEKKELTGEVKNKLLKQNENFAEQALRVLAAAYKITGDKDDYQVEEVESELVFLGLMGMIDPPRREVADSVRVCRKAGIRPIMITGDYPITAKAIASELGIYSEGDRIIPGHELEELDDIQLREAVMETSVFARVSPKHKSRIVDALQKNKQVVAMTGDGVNDAPALKEADIGIAMGITGTDVSKEASDMVLTNDNFASIVTAVEEGRHIYENIKKFIRSLLSCNIGEIITLFLALLIGMARPLVPIQILWVNLVTDGLPALALGVDPEEEDLMNKSPRDPEEGIFAGKMGFNVASQGIFIGLITLAAFYIGESNYSLQVGRTMAFATLSFSQLWHSLNSRTMRYSLFKIGFFTNKYLIAAIVISAILQLSVMFIPFLQDIFKVISLNIGQWLMIIIISASPVLFVELLKLLGLTYERKVK